MCIYIYVCVTPCEYVSVERYQCLLTVAIDRELSGESKHLLYRPRNFAF